MKKKFFSLVLCAFCFLAAARAGRADTLTLVSVGGDSAGGEYVYPYNFSLNGSSNLFQLMCLNLNRVISIGETWNVTRMVVPTDNSLTSINYRADAYLYSLLGGQYSAADIQFAVWSIFDPTDAHASSGWDATASLLATTALLQATNQSLINAGFYSHFTLYIPTSDQTGWTNGMPQEFCGVAAVTPEPASVLLLTTGILGGVMLAMRRRTLGLGTIA